MKRIIIFLLSLSIHVIMVNGQQIRLPRFFSDGMVVQRDSKIPVWGKSAPGDNVLVSLNGKKSKKQGRYRRQMESLSPETESRRTLRAVHQ